MKQLICGDFTDLSELDLADIDRWVCKRLPDGPQGDSWYLIDNANSVTVYYYALPRVLNRCIVQASQAATEQLKQNIREKFGIE